MGLRPVAVMTVEDRCGEEQLVWVGGRRICPWFDGDAIVVYCRHWCSDSRCSDSRCSNSRGSEVN